MKKSALKRHPSYDHPKNCRWLLGYSPRREKELTKNSGSSAAKMFGATSWNPKLGIGAVWLWHEFDLLLSVQIS